MTSRLETPRRRQARGLRRELGIRPFDDLGKRAAQIEVNLPSAAFVEDQDARFRHAGGGGVLDGGQYGVQRPSPKELDALKCCESVLGHGTVLPG